jgi:hypothetical protein
LSCQQPRLSAARNAWRATSLLQALLEILPPVALKSVVALPHPALHAQRRQRAPKTGRLRAKSWACRVASRAALLTPTVSAVSTSSSTPRSLEGSDFGVPACSAESSRSATELSSASMDVPTPRSTRSFYDWPYSFACETPAGSLFDLCDARFRRPVAPTRPSPTGRRHG